MGTLTVFVDIPASDTARDAAETLRQTTYEHTGKRVASPLMPLTQ